MNAIPELTSRPRVAVLGAGRMGGALGALAAKSGHPVVFGSRSGAAGAEAARAAGHGARAGSYGEAARDADLVILATRWEQALPALFAAGSLQGRVVLDATNPSAPDGFTLLIGHTTSGAEEIARAFPAARVVKAFNHVYAEVIDARPTFGGAPATVFYCGDHAPANEIAARFIRATGFDGVFAGPLRMARTLEPAAKLIVELVEGQGWAPNAVTVGFLRADASVSR